MNFKFLQHFFMLVAQINSQHVLRERSRTDQFAYINLWNSQTPIHATDSTCEQFAARNPRRRFAYINLCNSQAPTHAAGSTQGQFAAPLLSANSR